MQYRPEIDGLRAVAVLPVILFHAGVSAFGGGFVGVDVFFVISGYLITTIIWAEIREQRFSILAFYDRRARRILPALFFVILCTIPFAFLWMIPQQQQEYARSIVAVALFLSNVFFWRESDYFATAAEELPMLHTWSLAIEEQFYVFFPLLLLLLARYAARATVPVLFALTLASLALAQVMSGTRPSANFFLIPTRMWELQIGALCALHLATRPVARGQALSLLGLAMVLASVFAFDDRTPFPSLYALLPTLGTALIILFAGPGTWVHRLLSLRAMVGIGLISYSAYLWHQPLFAFARIRALDEPGLPVMLGLAALALVLATLSWRFVERPFRRHRGTLASHGRTLTVAALASLAVLGFGLAGSGGGGLFLGRFTDPDRVARLEEQIRPNGGLDDCGLDRGGPSECRTGGDPVIAVWGDSFAAHLVEGIVASAPDVGLVQWTMPRCGPFLNAAPYITRTGRSWSEACIAFNDSVLAKLEASETIEYVVVSSPFRAYVTEGWTLLIGDDLVPASPELAIELFEATLDRLAAIGKHPVVVSPTPQTGRNIGKCLARAFWLDRDPSACDFPLDNTTAVTRTTSAFLERIEQRYPVIWLDRAMCPGDICRTTIDGNFLFFDHGHLTKPGGRALGKEMNFRQMIVEASGARGG